MDEETVTTYTDAQGNPVSSSFQSTRYTGAIEAGKRALPELYSIKNQCCGCAACSAICPQDAITMQVDEKGFLYPVVEAERCIRCYKCVKICAFK